MMTDSADDRYRFKRAKTGIVRPAAAFPHKKGFFGNVPDISLD
jgi:hypothetical protein